MTHWLKHQQLFDPLLSTPAAARYLNVSTAWLEKKRCTGGGPVYIKISRLVSYRRSALDEYASVRERRSTSDPDRSGQEQAADPGDV